MIEFHDQQEHRFHDEFQAWRRSHPDGYFLTFTVKSRAQLHAVPCHHIGGVDWNGYLFRGGREQINSTTKNRKVCSESVGELLAWADKQSVTVKICRHCLKEQPDAQLFSKHNTDVPSDGNDEISAYQIELERNVEQARRNPDARRRRLESAQKHPEVLTATTTIYRRNPDVIAEVLDRAKGICESCKHDAPFTRASDGRPYLEVHHIKPLSEGGDDSVENAVAVCPNCHRHVHFG